jgi:hypothetical protein
VTETLPKPCEGVKMEARKYTRRYVEGSAGKRFF